MSISSPYRNTRLNLEQQKKRAKELFHQLKAHEPIALQRWQQYHPQAQRHQRFNRATFQPQLSDAQRIIAREQGLSSWAKLKAHIDHLNQARQAIAEGSTTAPDADYPTLHIRCGSDIQQGLQIAGFTGDFLEFADPFCQGPVPSDRNFAQFLQQRIRFIAQAYRIAINDAQARLEQEYARLHQSHSYPRVVLWFEHDAYDQLILAYLLHYFWIAPTRPAQLELICIGAFPGVQPFVGLGQLPPEALRTLWQQRQPITPDHLQLGHRVWQALTDRSPVSLNHRVQVGTPEIPLMATALRRHLQELPWQKDGLSLTQRLTLKILAEQGAMTGGQIFRQLTLEKEPLPYLGDTMYWTVLTDLSQCPHPPVEIVPNTASQPWAQQVLQLNDIGQDLLNHQLHWVNLNPIDRWVGGVHLHPDRPFWYWDEVQGQVISGG